MVGKKLNYSHNNSHQRSTASSGSCSATIRKVVLFGLLALACYSVFFRPLPPEAHESELFQLEAHKPSQQKQQQQNTAPSRGSITSNTPPKKTAPTTASTAAATTKTPKEDIRRHHHEPIEEQQQQQQQQHRVAGLSCDAFGGPSKDAAAEMVYWRDIPSDAEYASPLRQENSNKTLYLTFEPDEGGYNNIRMGMETAVALAVAMGRTLVLPPKMHMYLLWQGQSQKENVMGFDSFYHFDSVAAEHAETLEIITFEEFLQREALTGQLLDVHTGLPTFPPENRSDYTGAFRNFDQTRQGEGKPLWEWMRNHAAVPLDWSYDTCVVGIPAAPGKEAADHMQTYLEHILNADEAAKREWRERRDSYTGHPVAVDANATERLAELLANRRNLCVYNETLQTTKVVHSVGETNTGFRLLIHFYAFLFLEDWKAGLWVKRFVRDHLRYRDEIQCAAARIVAAVRKIAAATSNDGDDNGTGRFDSFHIRRGDFQYKDMHMDAQKIYANSFYVIPDNRTVYVATDEKNMTYFDPLRKHYNLLFLKDFKEQIADINPNYYGMLDQLVASRGEVFFGAYYSTFTGFINRMRGYHSQKNKLEGYEQGSVKSYYYVPQRLRHLRETMLTYSAVQQPFWAQEFPIGWRDLDYDVVPDDDER